MPTADTSCAAYITFKRNRILAASRPFQSTSQTPDYSAYTGYTLGGQPYITPTSVVASCCATDVSITSCSNSGSFHGTVTFTNNAGQSVVVALNTGDFYALTSGETLTIPVRGNWLIICNSAFIRITSCSDSGTSEGAVTFTNDLSQSIIIVLDSGDSFVLLAGATKQILVFGSQWSVNCQTPIDSIGCNEHGVATGPVTFFNNTTSIITLLFFWDIYATIVILQPGDTYDTSFFVQPTDAVSWYTFCNTVSITDCNSSGTVSTNTIFVNDVSPQCVSITINGVSTLIPALPKNMYFYVSDGNSYTWTSTCVPCPVTTTNRFVIDSTQTKRAPSIKRAKRLIR